MFEAVGKSGGRGRRGLAAWSVSVLLNGGVIGAGFFLTGEVTAAVEAPPEPVEVCTICNQRPVALPAAPAPAGPRSPRPKPAAGASAPTEPPPPAEPTPLPPDVDPTLSPVGPDSPAGAGLPGGPGGPGGGGEGPPCTDPEGCGGGGPGPEGPGGGPAIRTVHWSVVAPTHKVDPVFPSAARAMGLRESDCTVMIYIDGEGVPTRVESAGCADPFLGAAREAALQWRFTPLPEHASARFRLTVRFRSR